MKFLVITNHSYMLWQFRKELLSELLKSYDEVIVCTPFNDKYSITNLRNLGCRCVRARFKRRGMNPLKDIELYRFYYSLIKKENPEKVLTISIKPNIYAGFACSLLGVPYYSLVQGLGTAFKKKYVATLVTILYRAALKKAKLVFFENEDNANLFINRKIIDKKKVIVLNGAGVNTHFYNYEAYPSEENGINLLYLGRLMKEKGVVELISAFNNIKDRYNVTLTLVGFFEDDFREDFNNLLDKDSERILFYGFTRDPKKFYKKAHCVLVPSYHEGMNNVLLEASSTGRAVITSNIPGCREIVEEGVTGFLCEVKNTKSLENCIVQFLEKTPQEREEMGKKARSKVYGDFNKVNIVNKMVFYLVE